MARIDVTGNVALASVVTHLRAVLGFAPEQCYEVANPDAIPSIPITGDWWCTVAAGDGQFIEGDQDESQCSEQTEVIVTGYTRILTDQTDHAEDLLHDSARGCMEMKRQILRALVGKDLVTDTGDTFLRQYVWANRCSPATVGSLEGNDALIGRIQLTFRLEFDWDLT